MLVLIREGKVDPVLRYTLLFLVWITLVWFGQVSATRTVQITIFEIPARWSRLEHMPIEYFEAFKLFPWTLVLAPAVTLGLFAAASGIEKIAKPWIDYNDTHTYVSDVAAALVIFAAVPIFQRLYGESPSFAVCMSIAVFLFLLGCYIFSILLTGSKSEVESVTKKLGLGRVTVAFLSGALCFWLSFLLMTQAQSEGQFAASYGAAICEDITLVSVSHEDRFRPGWLISRTDSAVLLRELSEDVYRTIEIPTKDIREFTFLKRFGSNEERNRAFPGCSNSL